MTNNQPAKTPASTSAATPATTTAATPATTQPATQPATQPGNRIAAYLGIMLVALGLLTAVTSYSPLAGDISSEIGLTDVTYGLLGTVGPFTFAFVSLITPFVARRITLEWTIVIAAAMIGAGQVLRAVAGESLGFLAWSLIAMLGVGAGNLLLPPLVKRFFPDRIVSVSTVYLTVMVISTIYPPLLAVPIAQWVGWRGSIGVWGLIELIAVLPWLIVIINGRKAKASAGAATAASPSDVDHRTITKRVWSHPTSWVMLVMYAMATINFYTLVAWIPAILNETAGIDPATAGALLALYSAIGIPIGFFIAPIVAKVKNLGTVYAVIASVVIVGYLGLWFMPGTATWLWMMLAGICPTIFSFTLIATNYRTSNEMGGVTLAGMVTFGGYLVGGFAPLLVGVFAADKLDWGFTYALLIASMLVVIGMSFGLRRRVLVDQ
jgi:CP family cyanate transporter-like MFS transporter